MNHESEISKETSPTLKQESGVEALNKLIWSIKLGTYEIEWTNWKKQTQSSSITQQENQTNQTQKPQSLNRKTHHMTCDQLQQQHH